jgi:hypothetical protein
MINKKLSLKLGDIFEIKTANGYAYFQYTHKNLLCGELIRVLPGLFQLRPSNLDKISKNLGKIIVFFPVSAAAKKNICERVGNFEIPDSAKPFPLFRAGQINPNNPSVSTWWLWNGEKEWKVGELSSEEMKLPLREIVNDELLIEYIVREHDRETGDGT